MSDTFDNAHYIPSDTLPSEGEGVAVHGGFPNPGTDARRQILDLNQLLIQHSASTFLMRISGNEWWQEGIFHNDVAVIDRALDPQPGDRVIWWNDGVFAISEYTTAPKATAIWGVVTSVIHQLRKRKLAGEREMTS
jgi:SOS-response transcriptional repressor LexA